MPAQQQDKNTMVREVSKENAADNPVVQQLRRQVANAFVLYFNYKRYHWQSFGPLFRDMHKLFDEFAEEVLETIDPLAERVRMIGQDPPAAPVEVADLASVSPAAPHANVRDMLEEADQNLLVVIREMRAGAKAAEHNDDPGSVDIFSRLVQVHEKHEWWARDILRKGDGLTHAG